MSLAYILWHYVMMSLFMLCCIISLHNIMMSLCDDMMSLHYCMTLLHYDVMTLLHYDIINVKGFMINVTLVE